MLLEEGAVLGPRHSACWPRSAARTVRNRPPPAVVVISTGSELRDPGTPLGRDSIYDGQLLPARRGRPRRRRHRLPRRHRPRREPRVHRALSDQLVRADLVVTSGGVSEGDFEW